MKESIRIQASLPGKTRQQMNVELIATINHGDRPPLRHRVGRHPERKLKNQVIAVQQIDLSRRRDK